MDTAAPVKRPGWRRWVRRALLSLPVIPVAVLGAAVGLPRMTLPAAHETLHIPGLSAPVDITFDSDGVPRVRAATGRDAAAAIGWIHARDRMFQMELMRRSAAGRLSELAGAPTLEIDKHMRTLGLARLAEGDVAAQTPEARAMLEAYAAGVNAWIGAHGRFSGLEFLAMGKPAPWRPADSLMWGRVMGMWLSSNYRAELARQAMSGTIPRATLEDMWPMPPRPLEAQAALDQRSPADARAAGRVLAALPHFPAPFTMPASASNAWAVDGRWTRSGAPLLAGDPHLNFGFPGLWYLVRVETPGHVLAGATAPGVPFLVLGRNERIAWTFTTNGADTQDVYLEPPGAILTTREERIQVRGAPDTVLTIRESRHGPVISAPTEPVMAVAMMNLRPGDTSASGLLALNQARTVEEAGAAAPVIASPVQNLMVADHDKIALFVTGAVPIRRAGDGWAPVPGGAHGGEGDPDPYGWSGEAKGGRLPRIVAPDSGRLINANEPVEAPDSTVFMGRDAFRDWRARRIRTLLKPGEKYEAADFAAMQKDALSPLAVALLPVLRAVPGAPALLDTWDGTMTQDGAAPLIFSAWLASFRDGVLARAGLATVLRPSALAPPFDFVPHVLSPAGAHWCGGDCAPLLKQALERTMSTLQARFGPDVTTWRWDHVHQAEFAHPFLHAVPILSAWSTRRIGVAGDGATLDRGGLNEELEAVHGASYRGVYDLADLDRSLFMIAPGQSGNILSEHAWDFLSRWHDGATIELGPRPRSVTATARLEP